MLVCVHRPLIGYIYIYIYILTYQGIFVGGFLPFLGHGLWWAAGEETGGVENTSRDNDVLH